MDLGLAGRKAIVCASSQGLGLACAESLAREGALVYINGRHREKLEAAAAELAHRTGAQVVPVQADITTASGREALLAACPEPDILVNNNAWPPPGGLDDWTPEAWHLAVQGNMMSAIFLIQAVVRGMRQRRFGRIVSITSAMVKTPRPHMALSTASRTGLTAFAKALSLEVACDNVTLNQLLPERIDSPRQVAMTERLMAQHGLTWDAARARITDGVAARRFGTLREFGDACAYLCSAQASFISGQNLQLDGGSYPGLL
ncbi:MAG TPA: SDR family oxidoreductase [Ramlibacter sp.]|nr:SDR family oxidoreductase [Ramlibacter sp.]